MAVNFNLHACLNARIGHKAYCSGLRQLPPTQRRHINLGASGRVVSWALRALLADNLPVHSSGASCSASSSGGRTHELPSFLRSATVLSCASRRLSRSRALTAECHACGHASREIEFCVLRTHALVDLPTSPSQHRRQWRWRQLAQAGPTKGSYCSDCASGQREGEAMPPQRESRARDSSAAAAALSSSSSSNSSSGAARHDKGAHRGSSARGRSSEPSDAAEGSSSERAAAASSARRNGGRSRHGAATPAAASADASSSSSSSSSSKRRQSQDHNNRRPEGGVRSSSRMHQTGGSLDRRRSSSGSLNSNCSDEQEEEATCPLCMEALDETDRGLFPCECGYQAGRVAAWQHQLLMHL
ncbi:hypothetical protein Emag_002899 [Eimeria magna]